MSRQRSRRTAKRSAQSYLKLTIVAGLLVFVGWIWHLQPTCNPASLYLYELSKRMAEASHLLVPVGEAVRSLAFDGDFGPDPTLICSRDIAFEPPPWAGMGASALRRDTAPRYGPAGQPAAMDKPNLWSLRPAQAARTVTVDTTAALQKAVARAQPGTWIVLAPGRYRLTPEIKLQAANSGTADKPIVVRGRSISSVVLESDAPGPIIVDAPYWVISDLVVRGRCRPSPCAHLIDARASASPLTARNIFATGYRRLIGSQSGHPQGTGVADGITLIGQEIVDSTNAWQVAFNRVLPAKRDGGHYHQVCPPGFQAPDICDSHDLQRSIDAASANNLMLIRAGHYEQAAQVNTPGLHIIAEPGAVLLGKASAGKGALVTNTDLTLEGVECAWIKVPDGNGACVRQQSGDLTLIGVHFHHAQMGVLTGHEGGRIDIIDSYIHDSGYDEDGNLGHNIYVNSGILRLVRSWSLSARNEGHEVKSRAKRTEIQGSLIASLNGADSRLVDVPSGGVLTIEESVLAKGPHSTNSQLIGYGLEIEQYEPSGSDNRITIRHNTIYSDRPGGSKLLQTAYADQVTVTDNILIGVGSDWTDNSYFSNRSSLGLSGYPNYVRLNGR